jgi:hypothetical protein
MRTLRYFTLDSYASRLSRIRGHAASFLLLATVALVQSRAGAQCANDDLIIGPDGSGTPTLVFVINTEVSGTGGEGVGSVTFGTPNGAITQTQTLRIATSGNLIPDNANSCSATENTAIVTIEKTGILEMQGGRVETLSYAVTGPAASEAAQGGILRGFGNLIAKGGSTTRAFDLRSALLNPTGILSVTASRPGDQIALEDSTYRVAIGAGVNNHLNVVAGALQLTNTRLVVDFPPDFSATPGQEFPLVKFAGGSRSGVFSAANGAVLSEGATVNVNGVALKITYVGGSSGKDILLKADSPTPSLSISNVSRAIYEGSTIAPGSATFNVTLSAASSQTVTVNFQTARSNILTFTPGETLKRVTVTFKGDSVAELNETFFLDIRTPTNATIVRSRGSCYIRNDDGPSITIDNATTVNEGPAEGAPAATTPQTFAVRLSAASSHTITVDWATLNGTAGPADYTVASGRLSFAPGEIQKIITVEVKGDTLVEPNETYRVRLTRGTFAVIADSVGIGYIRNDDSAPGDAGAPVEDSVAPFRKSGE